MANEDLPSFSLGISQIETQKIVHDSNQIMGFTPGNFNYTKLGFSENRSKQRNDPEKLNILREAFAEWGDRSMFATIALGATQSPWGVASGAIVGHLVATSPAILGGAFLANYISEKLVSYLGGVLFLGFVVATLFEVF
ncbi:hypothetical protein P3S67_025178 [Capsicum chacoense]